MADGRRTRWVAHDVYFLDEGLGQAMFDRFGGVGIALWHGFIAACKKNHIEGETSFATDAEALSVFGLPGMPLVDLDGEPFELDDWLKLLSDHKVIRRRSRGRRVQVACTKWGRWQQAANRHRKAEQQAARRDEEAEQNRRSEGGNAGTVPPRNGHDTGPEYAQMTDTDTDTDRESASRKRSDQATRLPDGWQPSPEPDLVRAIGGQDAARLEFDKFCDYWRAKAGKDGRKLDWQATWRNWLRRASENVGTNGARKPKQDAVAASHGSNWR